MRAFITGIAGFAGSHLADALCAAGWSVAGLVAPGEARNNLRGIDDRLQLVEADVADAAAVDAAIVDAAPTCIFHLAAMAFVPDSTADPIATYRVNVEGTLNVLEAARLRAPGTRVVAVSSGDAYGLVYPNELPVGEAQPWRPLNPYAATKAMADMLADGYARQYGLPIVRARPFNHTGPRQSPRFVCADFARQVARIERGAQEPVLRVGLLTPRRDFSDVRDIVRAYAALADPSVPPGPYNIGSGRSVPIREILDQLLQLTAVDIRVEEEPNRVRPVEVLEVRAATDRLHAATGWTPRVPLQQTLLDTLAYWRTRDGQQALR